MYKDRKLILGFGKNTIFQIMQRLPEPYHQIWLLFAAIPHGLLWFQLQQHLVANFVNFSFHVKIFHGKFGETFISQIKHFIYLQIL